MNAVENLHDLIHRAYHGGPWHGSSLRELLDGLSASDAAARPLPLAHSIWEIVLHLTTWTGVVRARLAGEDVVQVDDERDWPKPSGKGDAAWRRALQQLDAEHTGLEQALARLPVAALARKAPGSSVIRAELLHGVLQHYAYHAGQIALLRKAIGR